MPKIGISTVAVLLFGPPGSGKGTVGKHLTGCFDIPHISTGDILREHVQSGDPLGLKVKALLEAGRFVPDDIVNHLLRERITRADCRNGFILDGYPRTVEQAGYLSVALAELDLQTLVVYLDVDYNKIIARLTARRSCPHCGSVYNVVSKPPLVEGVCDVDGHELVKRDDDCETVIRERLAAYDKLSQPLVGFFTATVPMFYRVDGSDGTPEGIAKRACELICKG